ncbi:MAG: TetR/AcrR family transcriptional regulator C-terminal domain-containing protein [Eubacteriales bacterium]|nr:TetR/AcrR family transcriptional regulator C-terminal domain-containing protein [Eubacteriales bacterium]
MSVLTERALAASLRKLLEKKTLDKITVKDITDDCGVNRQTFYYHFHDVYDLVGWIFTEEAKKYLSEDIDGSNWKANVRKITQRLIIDKNFVMNIFFSVNRRQLEKFMQNLVRPAFFTLSEEIIEENNIKIEKEDYDFVVDLYTFGLVGILTEWLADGMKEDYLDKLDKFLYMVDGTMVITLRKFDKES